MEEVETEEQKRGQLTEQTAKPGLVKRLSSMMGFGASKKQIIPK